MAVPPAFELRVGVEKEPILAGLEATFQAAAEADSPEPAEVVQLR